MSKNTLRLFYIYTLYCYTFSLLFVVSLFCIIPIFSIFRPSTNFARILYNYLVCYISSINFHFYTLFFHFYLFLVQYFFIHCSSLLLPRIIALNISIYLGPFYYFLKPHYLLQTEGLSGFSIALHHYRRFVRFDMASWR